VLTIGTEVVNDACCKGFKTPEQFKKVKNKNSYKPTTGKKPGYCEG
jgi:hypothetical protein